MSATEQNLEEEHARAAAQREAEQARVKNEQAAAQIRAGDAASAAQSLRVIAEDDATPQGLRQRALATLNALGEPFEPVIEENAGEEGEG